MEWSTKRCSESYVNKHVHEYVNLICTWLTIKTNLRRQLSKRDREAPKADQEQNISKENEDDTDA